MAFYYDRDCNFFTETNEETYQGENASRNKQLAEEIETFINILLMIPHFPLLRETSLHFRYQQTEEYSIDLDDEALASETRDLCKSGDCRQWWEYMNELARGAPEDIKEALTEKFPQFKIQHDVRLCFWHRGSAAKRDVIILEDTSINMPADVEIMYPERVVLCLTKR